MSTLTNYFTERRARPPISSTCTYTYTYDDKDTNKDKNSSNVSVAVSVSDLYTSGAGESSAVPLSAVPLTPASSSPHNPQNRPTRCTSTITTSASASACASADPDQTVATPRQRRIRPPHRRELSITVPPPSRSLQSSVVPVQPQPRPQPQQNQSQCLRTPFALRGTTRTPTPTPGGRPWSSYFTNARQEEKSPYSVYTAYSTVDPENIPSSALSFSIRGSGGRKPRPRPPAIVFAVLASLVFILVTFVLLAPDAIREALKDHLVEAWKHLCFDKPRGVISKDHVSWGPPTPEEVQQLLDW